MNGLDLCLLICSIRKKTMGTVREFSVLGRTGFFFSFPQIYCANFSGQQFFPIIDCRL